MATVTFKTPNAVQIYKFRTSIKHNSVKTPQGIQVVPETTFLLLTMVTLTRMSRGMEGGGVAHQDPSSLMRLRGKQKLTADSKIKNIT